MHRKPASALSPILFLSLALCAAAPRAEEGPASYEEQPARAAWKAPSFGFGVQAGINGMAGIAGVTLSWYPDEQFAMDAGIGVGALGANYGLRGRGFFWQSRHVHPYGGLGFKHSSGSGDATIDMNYDVQRGNETRHYAFEAKIDPTNFVDAQGGVEFRFGHFLLRPGLGWSQKLGGTNWHVVSGDVPTSEDKKPLDIVLGSGPTMVLESGFAF